MGEEWILEVQSEIESLNLRSEAEAWEKKSIYKVPEMFTMINREPYVPKLASFGPYHHGHLRLLPMEPHKRRALVHFLKRGNSSMKEVVNALRPQVQQLMDSYDGLDEKWANDKNGFLKMMILDGAFMMEIMLFRTPLYGSYDWRDPVFYKSYALFKLMGDMLLLENQLPIHLLSTLAAFGGDQIRVINTNNLILNFFAASHVGNKELASIHATGLHALDIYRNALLHRGRFSPISISAPRSAQALHESGVEFRCSQSKGFKDISFDNGILFLPPIDVDNTTEAILRNLIAFENVHGGHAVIAYVFFMDGLINSAKDVALLREKGIMKVWFGSDEDIASLFNSLTKDVTLPMQSSDSGVDVSKQLREHCRRRWNEWRAYFVHTYLRNPWVFISLVAAFVLLFLTVMQTVYAVLSYNHSN